MIQKKKIKLKPAGKKLLLLLSSIVVLFIFVFGFIQYQKSRLYSLGYSKRAVQQIMHRLKWNDVVAIGKNKTVNAAFESQDYQEKNLDSYTKIEYQKQKDIIKNINTLLKKGYKVSEISLILSRGDNEAVSAFAKRDKVAYLDEFFSIPYSKLENYDRYLAYQNLENEDVETTVLLVNMGFDKEDYVDPMVISTFDEQVLVNKHRQLSEDYTPTSLVDVPSEMTKTTDTVKVEKSVLQAFEKMANAALQDNVYLLIGSGYRTYQEQQEIVDTYLKAYGQNYVDRYLPRLGFSEHQTGMSIDVASKVSNVFVESKEYEWMMDNAYLYGFILRYPKSKEEITGYKCEAWHYRYVGEKIAKYMKKHNMTYDEYYIEFLDR